MKTHRIAWTLALLMCAQHSATAAPIDEFRLSNIEQSIRALQTQLREQARLIDELQRQVNGSSGANSPPRSSVPASNTGNSWLDAAHWKRLRNGMSELEVVSILGPPTQMRVSDDQATRTLLYAMEIGSSGFLSGNVVFGDGRLIAVNTPVLK